jgi:hypothetical protein
VKEREKAPKMEGMNQRGKRILWNTLKVNGSTSRGREAAYGRDGPVRWRGEREAGDRLGQKGRMGPLG